MQAMEWSDLRYVLAVARAGTLAAASRRLGVDQTTVARRVAAAETHGIEDYPLYAWTKATIENPEKKANYLKAFTLYVEGDEVYAKPMADALEADLRPLIGKLIARLSKHDTNPANNPQAPAEFRQRGSVE